MRKLTHSECLLACQDLVDPIQEEVDRPYERLRIFPVPRGGVPVAYMLRQYFKSAQIVEDPEKADIIVDDLIDSGATFERYTTKYPSTPFLVLFDKRVQFVGEWLVFPWEESDQTSGANDIPVRLLQYIGEDPQRGGLLETPKRFLKAWDFWTQGYGQDPVDVLKVFQDGAEKCDEMILVKDIPVYSQCEHHLAPFFGVAHVSYIPDGRIVGLSKLSRLVDIFARRLQVQERLTNQIADALNGTLKPLGVGVVIECRHLCMESRGIQRQGSSTTTSAMRGAMLEDQKARAEFMALIK